MKLGIIGCGRVSMHYSELKNQGKLDFIEFVSCYDSNSKKAYELSENLGCKVYEEEEDFLSQQDLDFVLVLTPSGNHFNTASKLLRNGMSVIIEKPMTLIPKELKVLENIAHLNRTSIYGILQNRFNPAVVELENMIRTNQIGRLLVGGLRLRWGRTEEYYSDGWHGTWLMDGGVISQQGVHHIFALDQLFGPIIEVAAISSNRRFNIKAEDSLVGYARTFDGALFTLELTTSSYQGDYQAEISCLTEKGLFELGGISLNTLKFRNNGTKEEKILAHEEVLNGYGYGHVQELMRIKADLEKNKLPIIDINNSRRALMLIHSIYSSIENGGKPVKVIESNVSKRLGV